MKDCMLCGNEQEDVSLESVVPAEWNGFNNFAQVCAACKDSRRFKMWATTQRRKASVPALHGLGEAPPPVVVPVKGEPAAATVTISHRRTGALLHVVESHSLAKACLSGIALSGADLQHAAMRGADLQRADLHLAFLAGADLRDADLRGVNLRGADLRGADLRHARLYQADLQHARYDGWTQWPADFDPRASGALKEARNG
jgi:hypothetical protein